MNDEIKEIKIKTIGQLLDFVETEEKAKELINYITNLQEKVEQLEKENKEIYETQKEYGCRILDTCDFIEQRIRKDGFLNLNEWETRDLLNILQGENKE